MLIVDDDIPIGGRFTDIQEYGEFAGLAYFCQDLDRYSAVEFESKKSAINAELRAMGVPEEIFGMTDGSCMYSGSGAVLIVSEWRPMPR
jgi:hypothetical protein